jgi:hypothetical protein
VPLNHLDVDGGVLCGRCGLDQAFDVSAWQKALRHAHAVAEMFGHYVPRNTMAVLFPPRLCGSFA